MRGVSEDKPAHARLRPCQRIWAWTNADQAVTQVSRIENPRKIINHHLWKARRTRRLRGRKGLVCFPKCSPQLLQNHGSCQHGETILAQRSAGKLHRLVLLGPNPLLWRSTEEVELPNPESRSRGEASCFSGRHGNLNSFSRRRKGCAFPKVKAAGAAYAIGLNQQFIVWVAPPAGQEPLKGLPTLLGRRPWSRLFNDPASMPGEKTKPLSAVVMPVHSQPPIKPVRIGPASDRKRCPRPNGNSRVCPSVNTLARSNNAGP